MMIRSALPSIFLAAAFSGAALSVASVEIEDEDVAVFAADLDRLAGVGALVEEVETRLRIVVWNPFADGLPRRHDGLEGFDVEGRVRWWRDVDDSFPESVESEEELDLTLRCAPFLPWRAGGLPSVGSLGRKTGSTTFMVPLQHGHWSGSAPQTRRMRSRQSGRMARAVTLGGGGMIGGFATGCFSSADSVSAADERGVPRLLFE